MKYSTKIAFVVLAFVIGISLAGVQYGEAFLHSNDKPEVATPEIRAVGGVSDDVWQESCNPIIILQTGTSCQQANVLIQQQAEILKTLQIIAGTDINN